MKNISLYTSPGDILAHRYEGSADHLIRFRVAGMILHVAYYPHLEEKVVVYSTSPVTVIDEVD